MNIKKESEYHFLTVTVGYLTFTSVDGVEEEIRVEGEYDENGFMQNQRILLERNDDILYDAGLLLVNEIKDMDKLLEHLDKLINDY
ncbi:MAG: hypothetical protein Unbinned6046contig1000_71 [Prokaryotic dsDNA virus sp.]|nr:MAG: hypothetical protein Unbinned6046contig1000_71 [Prokaryotic dsDNA virus sp.]|tara:strand:+ start:1019 stop:1276 length:258 start_codon:yes stop_codon:yes gene_type:complete